MGIAGSSERAGDTVEGYNKMSPLHSKACDTGAARASIAVGQPYYEHPIGRLSYARRACGVHTQGEVGGAIIYNRVLIKDKMQRVIREARKDSLVAITRVP